MSRDLEADLRSETLKWLEKAEWLFCKISPKDNRFAENIAAYLSDSRHFLDNGDLIRAFEAVIWAWAWMEIGKEIGLLVECE
jgi:uncharacterized protein